ncbi:MAG: URC4/urg3 family protein [Okeania sp. SIO2G4]|uniref:URC4/urg3 family protein n=1 Tax=unclassified Okeania TaxID=2634635 RepID=UPI0013B740B7|nr:MULTISPECIES: URC4/urg3 family protein [unclassified Okeania]NEP06950.1 URC4/urg3 family protein [Okeania sp. SIO4D6]NEP74294.1 URC4/urg3 family protein [Okeania sp. SIO2G5]NEP95293.1 URC4/urg3 family protein [Okeania sp. SIO2F5]NEQ93017.1 URC4/urg3 family protein [Okeania sp. SIO2G4]
MNKKIPEVITYLRTAQAIRERCDCIFNLACQDQLNNFQVDLTQLDKCANYVINIIYAQYPKLDIPFHSRWRHFQVGDVPRLAELDQMLAGLTPVEKAKVKFDLAIISVLLDAGAGANWQYTEPETGLIFSRSEGLAVCSFRLFCQGFFSSNPDFPWQADTRGLSQIDVQTLTQGFQVSPENPLVGLEGRLELLQRLGQVLNQDSHLFGIDSPRPGNMVDYLWQNQANKEAIKATSVLNAVLEGLGDIWPGRSTISGINLGDVWPHSLLKSDRLGDEYIPFHKLSQWLTYSLLEPLQELGLKIIGLDDLTGLAEYRNGGLFIDMELIKIKNPLILQQQHLPGSEIIVEWRALTISLLDKVAQVIQEKLNLNTSELPLVKILQGGTWTAGRKIATELRKDGAPPIKIKSDGTVF